MNGYAYVAQALLCYTKERVGFNFEHFAVKLYFDRVCGMRYYERPLACGQCVDA